MNASKLLRPLTATALAVAALGVAVPAASAGIGIPQAPAAVDRAADMPGQSIIAI